MREFDIPSFGAKPQGAWFDMVYPTSGVGSEALSVELEQTRVLGIYSRKMAWM